MGTMRDRSFVNEEKCENRLINHAKDSDFSVEQISIKDIIPENSPILLTKEKSNQLILTSIQRQKTTCSRPSPSPMVKNAHSELGLTLQTLIDLTTIKTGGMDFDSKKLVDEVFAESTSSKKCAMIDCLKGSYDSQGYPAVSKMNFFVSYS